MRIGGDEGDWSRWDLCSGRGPLPHHREDDFGKKISWAHITRLKCSWILVVLPEAEIVLGFC